MTSTQITELLDKLKDGTTIIDLGDDTPEQVKELTNHMAAAIHNLNDVIKTLDPGIQRDSMMKSREMLPLERRDDAHFQRRLYIELHDASKDENMAENYISLSDFWDAIKKKWRNEIGKLNSNLTLPIIKGIFHFRDIFSSFLAAH